MRRVAMRAVDKETPQVLSCRMDKQATEAIERTSLGVPCFPGHSECRLVPLGGDFEHVVSSRTVTGVAGQREPATSPILSKLGGGGGVKPFFRPPPPPPGGGDGTSN